MTLIIGILCDSGIVVGGDGAATLAAPNKPTICQNNCKKLYKIDDKIIFASSGFTGLAQRLKGVVEGLSAMRNLFLKKTA